MASAVFQLRRSCPYRRRLQPAAWVTAAALLCLTGVPRALAVGSGLRGHALHGAANGRGPGYLGIGFHDTSEDQLRGLQPNSPHGAEVIMVDHDGPAGKAGIRPHDIIVSLNGQAIAGAQALKQMLHDAGAGVEIALTVLRGGHPLQLKARLADRDEVARVAMAKLVANEGGQPPPAVTSPNGALALNFAEHASADAVTPDSPPTLPATPAPGSGFLGHIVHGSIYTGAVLDTMEPQLAGFFGAPQGCGLLVRSVVPNSPAAEAGLRAGDVVVRADLYMLRNTADWTKRLHAAKGKPITLSVVRDRRELTLTLQQDLKHHSMVEWPKVF